jgi:hypothetical protein
MHVIVKAHFSTPTAEKLIEISTYDQVRVYIYPKNNEQYAVASKDQKNFNLLSLILSHSSSPHNLLSPTPYFNFHPFLHINRQPKLHHLRYDDTVMDPITNYEFYDDKNALRKDFLSLFKNNYLSSKEE